MPLPSNRSRLTLVVLLLVSFVLVACEPTGGTGGPSKATTVTVSPAYLSFDGTSSATISVTANGSWTLVSDSPWLKVSRASGSTGTTTVNVTVDRASLSPRQYAGELTISGSRALEAVTVSMRFPTVSGQLSDAEGRVTAGSRAPGVALAGAAAEAAASEVIPGEYLVLLSDGMARVLEARAAGVSLQAVEPRLATFQAMASTLAGDHGVAVRAPVVGAALPVMVVKASDGEVASLAADGRVRLVEPNRRWVVPRVEPAAIDVGYDFGLQWHYEDINLDAAWGFTEGDAGVVVAVIDGGFATYHKDLRDNLLPGYDFAFMDPDPSSTTVCLEHGTHVAGTVAATWNSTYNIIGVAPGVKVRPVRVGYESGGDCALDMGAVLNGLGYAAGYELEGVPRIPPVDVINMSLGGYGYSEIFDKAVGLVLEAGVSIVAAAGNDGVDTVMYPAAYDGVIGVSAIDITEQLASYSNAGPQIDVAAPGGDVTTDLNGDGYADGVLSLGWYFAGNTEEWVFMDGTSMASPHVAGVVALMKSVNPDLDPATTVFLLRSSARDLGLPGPDTYYGWGMVDAGAAVEMARDASRARFSEVIVRLRSGASVVASVKASASGAFSLGQVPAGSYTLEAGTDRDGDGLIDDLGEFYASASVTVTYEGDVVRNLDVTLR